MAVAIKAEASFTRLSPSNIVITFLFSPKPFIIPDAATASGETTALIQKPTAS
jgi:hypothetical protein